MVLASADKRQAGSTPARVWNRVPAAPRETITPVGLPETAVASPTNPWKADAPGNWSTEIAVSASLTAYNLKFIGSERSTNSTNYSG
jgi:hypothetical protein